VLGQYPLIACIATHDPDLAKPFYRDVLGLRLVSEDELSLIFDADGTMLRIFIVQDHPAAKYAVLGWQVPDLLAMAQQLAKAGAELLKFPNFHGMDERGIWTDPNGVKMAWFNDPDQNMLILTQR
jgi:catechol 2,3-dioxygenase-like lactoylglutathione lyase family enzyme